MTEVMEFVHNLLTQDVMAMRITSRHNKNARNCVTMQLSYAIYLRWLVLVMRILQDGTTIRTHRDAMNLLSLDVTVTKTTLKIDDRVSALVVIVIVKKQRQLEQLKVLNHQGYFLQILSNF